MSCGNNFWARSPKMHKYPWTDGFMFYLTKYVNVFHCGTELKSWPGLEHGCNFVSFFGVCVANAGISSQFPVRVCHTYLC